MSNWFEDLLMKISPHDEESLEANTDNLRRDIQDRQDTRDAAARRSKDYVELQLEIMRRK